VQLAFAKHTHYTRTATEVYGENGAQLGIMSGMAVGNNKGWIRSVIAHRHGLPVPYNFSFSPPALAALQNHLGVADVKEALNLPIRTVSCKSVKPQYASPGQLGPTIADEFGVVWSTNDIDRGSPVTDNASLALSAPDLRGYRFPDPAAAYRFEHLALWCSANREHFTIIWVGDLWERATFMRGMENILLDVAINPEFVRDLLRRLADCILQTMEILFARFEFDAIALSDDYGTQRSMLISPDCWRALIRPLLAEIVGAAKRRGRIAFLHSCGNVEPIIPDLIDLGLDILHPIQPEAMDILALKRQFGRDLTFCGGLRTQDLLPRGTPDQIRDEVRRLKRDMGAGGGYILEPGITVQADVPLENMLAMIDEARKG